MLKRMWSKGNTHPLLVGKQTCTTTLEISMVVSQRIGNPPTSGSSNTTLGHRPKRCLIILQDLCPIMFIAALFVIVSTQKQARCPSTEEWIKKIKNICRKSYQNNSEFSMESLKAVEPITML